MNKKGAYIHIPFCKSICSYCDFCKVLYKKEWVIEYFKKLNIEIKDMYMDDEIDTLYIGGGTPSALNIKELTVLFKILSRLKLSETFEFTFECNLNDINKDLLSFLKENKVNRLSIGIESFDPTIQKIIHRKHTFKEALEKINLCRELGFSNINIDLIYGFKEQTLKTLKKDIKLFLKLKPNHISTYSLILEEGTILKKESYETCSEDLDYAMYTYICKKLKRKHYKHYEVSNFALDGCFSKHNLKYWNNEEYYGFGLGASGYIEDIRYNNTRSLTDYIKNEEFSEKEILTQNDIMDNELMLGFRKIEGISLQEFKNKYKMNMEDAYPIKPLLKNKDLVLKNGYIKIHPKKLYVMNEILIKLI